MRYSFGRLQYPVVAAWIVVATAAGCRASPQEAFWRRLSSLCNHAYEGHVTESSLPDSSLMQNRLVMYVRECNDTLIRIPFHVGEDTSRTWILTRTPEGLRLKHEHAGGGGAEGAITDYGGETATEGDAARQDFPADVATARLLPAAAHNVWTLEVIPDERFAYSLRREGTDRRIRIEFDLRAVVTGEPGH